MAALSTLRSLVKGTVTGTIILLALSFELYPDSTACLTNELARGSLRLIQQLGAGGLSQLNFNYDNFYDCPGWGQLIRCSPHSSCTALLDELQDFVPPSWLNRSGVHEVVQWLKALPEPPLQLIRRWQGYMTESGTKERRDIEREDADFLPVHFQKPSASFDEEEIIRCCEHYLKWEEFWDAVQRMKRNGSK
ncbi:hypothetical protein B0H19DRAFT_110138 [Mycena capillaripes]|nr:hypothetical protein B0H19DRAFT_110138 [Mycena capillaripes]